MGVEIKFCGLTRREDALEAAALGASYVGVILASGPRLLTVEAARDLLSILDDVSAPPLRVGVFGARSAPEIAEIAAGLHLDVVQLHGEPPSAGEQAELRRRFDGQIWGVAAVSAGTLPPASARMFAEFDAVLLDAKVGGRAGGTGVALPWTSLAEPLAALRRQAGARLVLAGGLRPENVADGIRILEPDVVDVSSGVESAPGVKDHARMRAFRDAVEACRVER